MKERKGNICDCGGYLYLEYVDEKENGYVLYRKCERCDKIILAKRSEDRKEINDLGGKL